MLPYWFNATLAALPAVLWMVIGLGLPYALAALPRKDWRDKPLVAMTALAVGPALMTAWMFLLGTLGGIKADDLGLSPRTPDPAPLLALDNILIGSLILALIGIVLAWRKRNTPLPARSPRVAFAPDERILVLMIVAALVLRWLSTSYWNFTAYDTLWVYGYQGRLYALLGYIPSSIGYYPPFLQLQYTYAQLGAAVVTGNVIDDHAARAIVPFLHLGSVLAAYVLGKQVFKRRVGVFAAALWALYPHVGEWAQVGDLEIPLTFAFTGAAAFFLKAWTAQPSDEQWRERLHNAALAGLFLGIALWTKPTAGAFILGVGLLLGLEIVRIVRKVGIRHAVSLQVMNQICPRLEIVLVTGLASIPLGGLWYVRNLVYGHPPITLPNPFWLTQALRSGAEFGWLLLALLVLIAYLIFAPRPVSQPRPSIRLLLVGLVFIFAAIMPTILMPYTAFNVPNRMDGLEWLTLLIGLTIIGFTLWRYGGKYLTPGGKWDAIRVGWALALAVPYFVTWFLSYSYHYRLSFPIVPLMALPSAVVLARLADTVQPSAFSKTAETQSRFRISLVGVNRRFVPTKLQTAYRLAVLLIALPGVFNTLYTHAGGWDWLWSSEFPDEFTRQQAANTALAWTVRRLDESMQAEGLDETTVIVAPGLQRLPFFFPLHDIRVEAVPTRLEELGGVEYYLYTQEAAWYYPENDLPLLNQVTGSMRRLTVMDILSTDKDGTFFAHTFRVRESERRFRLPRNLTPPVGRVQFGDFATFAGYRLLNENGLQLAWQAIKPAERDYTILIQLLDDSGTVLQNWDAKPAYNEFITQGIVYSEALWYATTLWQPGEYIIETRTLPDDLPAGDYKLQIGFYDSAGRVPVIVGGEASDRYTFTVPVSK